MFEMEGSMERILVSMDSAVYGQEAVRRGIALAKRIAAELNILVVLPPDSSGARSGTLPELMKNRLDLVRRWAQEEGLSLGCYVTVGRYEQEVVRFVRDHRITLMVTESSFGESRANERDHVIEAIRHRIPCRLELVSPKKQRS